MVCIIQVVISQHNTTQHIINWYSRCLFLLISYNCNQPGHMSKECPEKTSSSVWYVLYKSLYLNTTQRIINWYLLISYNCNQSGHISKECPEKTSSSVWYVLYKSLYLNTTQHIVNW